MNRLFWEIAEQEIGLTNVDIQKEYMAWFQWHNRTNYIKMRKLLEEPRFRELSKFRYYVEIILGLKDKAHNLISWEDYKSKLTSEVISLYRGGAGIWDPNMPERYPFVAMTANFEIAKMFAKFSDAKALHIPAGDERKEWWIVRVKLCLSDILAYRDMQDQEVWIPIFEYKAHAELIEQCK